MPNGEVYDIPDTVLKNIDLPAVVGTSLKLLDIWSSIQLAGKDAAAAIPKHISGVPIGVYWFPEM